MAHWSGRFAGRFSQEGSIGFVRTSELIQYLKETCRRIDLPNLPVAEFKELQVRLRQHRKVERSSTSGGSWSMLPTPRGSDTETTMAWLPIGPWPRDRRPRRGRRRADNEIQVGRSRRGRLHGR